jgi:hypothetical protein
MSIQKLTLMLTFLNRKQIKASKQDYKSKNNMRITLFV